MLKPVETCTNQPFVLTNTHYTNNISGLTRCIILPGSVWCMSNPIHLFIWLLIHLPHLSSIFTCFVYSQSPCVCSPLLVRHIYTIMCSQITPLRVKASSLSSETETLKTWTDSLKLFFFKYVCDIDMPQHECEPMSDCAGKLWCGDSWRYSSKQYLVINTDNPLCVLQALYGSVTWVWSYE